MRKNISLGRTILVLGCALLLCNANAAPTSETELWLAPLGSAYNRNGWGALDFLELFKFDPRWGETANRLKVLKLYPSFMSQARNEDLKMAFNEAHKRGIRVALEASVLTDTKECNEDVKGDDGEFTIKLLQRLATLNLKLDIIAMNEPFLHAYRQRKLFCNEPPEIEASRNAASVIHNAKQIFPDVEIGDIEAVGNWAGMDVYMDTLLRWPQAFEKATGQKLAFMHADVGWLVPWIDTVGRFGLEMKRLQIPFGIIFNGIDTDLSSQTWVQNAVDHFIQYEGSGYPSPDMVVIQSWARFPARLLPETDPGSLTYVAWQYVLPKSVIHATISDSILAGSITAASSNMPIANLSLSLFKQSANADLPNASHEIQGNVPDGAETAVISIRMNTECACNTETAVDIAGFSFDHEGGRVAFSAPFRGWDFSGKNEINNLDSQSHVYSIKTVKDSKFVGNSPKFKVTAGQPFRFSSNFSIKSNRDGGGVLALRFLDANGKEITRTYIFLEKKWILVGNAKTDVRGHFEIPVDKVGGSEQLYKVQTDPSGAIRPSIYYLHSGLDRR